MAGWHSNSGDASSSSSSYATKTQWPDSHGGGLAGMTDSLQHAALGDREACEISMPPGTGEFATVHTANSTSSGLEEMLSMNGGIASKEEELEMVEKIASVFMTEEVGSEDEVMDEGVEEPLVDEEDVKRRTELLKGVFGMIGKLWLARSDHFDSATEKLADGSRDPKWRLPIGEVGILTFYLEIYKSHPQEQSTKIQILRLIGNSCADTDENRGRLVSSNFLPHLIVELRNDSLLPFAIPVLHNICIDYEPAQKQASECRLTEELMNLISSNRLSQALSFVGYICKILDLMVAQDSEKELAPERTAYFLVKLATNLSLDIDLEDFLSLVTTATHYLAIERLQLGLIQFDGVATTLDILSQSYTRYDLTLLDTEDAASLNQLRAALNQVLSDVSALPNFRELAVPPSSPIEATLRRWLISPYLQLQICSCIILGNVARSDAICEELVQQSQIHLQLISIISTATDTAILHSTLGFLKNLALPLANKPILGEAGLFDVLPRLWGMDVQQQIQFTSVSLARQVIQNTFTNVRFLGRPLSKDPTSLASTRTKLSLLIALFDRTDIDPIKMEISRLITALCRVWNSITDPTIYNMTPERLLEMRRNFFERHPDIGRPLAFMVSQSKWPVVRSEGWFVFALMSRVPEGADRISDVMHDPQVFEVLVHLMTGKGMAEFNQSNSSSSVTSQETTPESSSSPPAVTTSPNLQHTHQEALSPQQFLQQTTQQQSTTEETSQTEQLQKIDRMNALVLLTELLKNKGDKMAVMRRAMFEELVRQGGGIVSEYTDQERVGGTGGGGGGGGGSEEGGGGGGKGKGIPIEMATKGRDIADVLRQSTVDLM